MQIVQREVANHDEYAVLGILFMFRGDCPLAWRESAKPLHQRGPFALEAIHFQVQVQLQQGIVGIVARWLVRLDPRGRVT
jgi:hypothetical protein